MEETPEQVLDRLARYRESVKHPQRTRLVVAGVMAAVVVVVIAVSVAQSGSGGGHGPTVGGGTSHTAPGRAESPSTPAADRPSGTVVADSSRHYGQSPSSGTCAHWSQRFVNQSDARIVRIAFAPASAQYTKGSKGTAGYRAWVATTPPAAELNVSIDPDRAQDVQFMICTTTPPPATGVSLVIGLPHILRWTWQDGISGSGRLHG